MAGWHPGSKTRGVGVFDPQVDIRPLGFHGTLTGTSWECWVKKPHRLIFYETLMGVLANFDGWYTAKDDLCFRGTVCVTSGDLVGGSAI